jgi:LPS sulfotransferase NodH
LEFGLMTKLFFMMGCPRSGTSLLNRMVNAHPQIFMAKRVPWLAQRYEQRENLTPDGTVTPQFIQAMLDRGKLGKAHFSPEVRNELEKLLVAPRRIHYADLILAMWSQYAAAAGKSIIGTKTLKLVRGIPTLHELWPDAKFIHIIRDGHDVCLSAIQWRRAPSLAEHYATWRTDAVSTAALWWEWHVRTIREGCGALGPKLYYEVRYERLVSEPRAECEAICEFLEVSHDDAMMRFNEGRVKTTPGLTAKHAWLPPTPGLRNWRTQMPPEDIQRFESVAGDLLEELGYGLGSDSVSSETRRNAAELRNIFEERPRPAYWSSAFALLGERN